MTAQRLTPAAIALLLAFSATLHAQTPKVDIIPYLITGYRTVPTEKLSDFLSENGFGDDPLSDEPFGDKVAIGGGMDIETNRWMMQIEATTDLPKTQKSDLPDISFNSIGLQLNGGYQLLPAGNLEIYPLLGLGLRFSSLNVQGREAANRELHGNAGLGVGYEIYRRRRDSSITTLSLGLRGEYSLGLTDSWSGRPAGVNGDPDMKLRGFSIWLGARIHWQL